ncbi:MAG: ACT domain-containing protein [Gudongella sp.]|nr:ACT domain-containing protein [Gudongella sp.]
MSLTMKLLKDEYGVARLDVLDEVPKWVVKGEFYSITKTEDELSILCSEIDIPSDVKCERNWRILKVEGPLDFSLVGILSSISAVLAKVKISIFVISTFDTDYILVKDKDLAKSIESLRNGGYNIIE